MTAVLEACKPMSTVDIAEGYCDHHDAAND